MSSQNQDKRRFLQYCRHFLADNGAFHVERCMSVMQSGTQMVKLKSGTKALVRLFYLDEHRTCIRWRPSRKSEKAKIIIDSIYKVTEGRQSEIFHRHAEGNFDPSCCFTIYHGNHMESLDLITSNPEEARTWITGLKYLMAGISDEDSLAKRQRTHDQWVKQTFEEADKNGDGLLNIEEIYQLMHKLNVNLPRRKVRQMFQEADTDENQGTLTFEEFSVFYKMMSLRRDLYLLLLNYSDKKDHLTVDDLAQFFKVEQKMNNVTTEYCIDIIQKFEVSEENKEQHVLGIDGFTNFMRSPAGDIFNPQHCEIYQDMDQPLCSYYIASSHNTYLTGDQLLSQSKVDMYAWVLQDGCRCIEVDCWDGPDGEPVVHHGYTLTSKVLFKDVVETINKHAFVKNEYPVILSIENHCNIQQQRKIAQYMKDIFGDKLDLSSVPLGESKQLPSPQNLKGKILVKGKKLPYDLADDAEEGEVSDEDSADEIEEECKLTQCFSNGTTEHQVESFIRKKLESLLKESQIRDKEDPDSFTVKALLKATHEGLNVNLKQNDDTKDCGKSKRSSVGSIAKHKKASKSRSKSCSTSDDEDSSPKETTAQAHRLGRRRKTMKLCRALSDLVVYTNSVAAQDIVDDGTSGNVLSFSETRAHQVVQHKSEQLMLYNQKQLTRIYPSAYRIDSSNFNPVAYWNAGIQLVALNYQTEGRMMELNRAKFKMNGGCGYVLKPQQMCKGVFNQFSADPLPASPKKQLILKIISGQQLPKPPDSMLGDRGEIIDPFVEVEIIGLPVDCCKEQTRVVDDNGFNPVWEETLTFTVHMPEIALVRFLVWDHDPIGRDFVGQRTVAFNSLMPGYRHVYLDGLTEASIFVHVTINEIYGKWSPLILNPSYTILHFLGATKNRQFIGLKGFFNRSSKHSSVESNSHVRKKSIGDRILRRSASAPAKARKKTKMVFQESTESKDIVCETSGAKERDFMRKRTSRSLQARPVSMPVDKLLLGAFEPSTSEISKETRSDIASGSAGEMQAKHQEKPEMTKLDLPVHKNNLAIQHSSPLFKDCHQTENPVNKPVHKKWRSLHLEKQNYDDIRELNDTFTSESDEEILKPKEGNEKEAMLLLDKMESIPENTKHHAKADLFSVTDLSSTICTDMNHLQSTAPLLETDISHIISEVPSVNESELGSTVSALIRHFEITEDKTNLTFVSSLQGPNSQSNFCDNSDVLISDLLNRKKHTRQSLHSASNTTVFSSPETSEYSIYTFIHEEHVPPDANYKLMDANNGISSCSNLKNNSSNSWLDSSESLQFCSQYNANSNTLGLKSKQSRPQVSLKTSSGCTDENVKQISSHNSFLKNLNVDSNPKRIADKNFLHTGVNRYATQACPNSQNTGIQHGSGQLYQNRHSSYKPRADAPRDKQYIAQSGNLHSSPNANWPKPSNYHIHSLQGIKQPSPCISKSLGDLTSDDISCNFESKYKRINRGFLSSAICPENTSLAQSRPQSTDALTEQLRKLMSFDQDDSNRPSYYEEEEWDSPKPLTRKLSSRSQSRVRNIANRAKERQEANKIKQSNLNSSEVVLRNKRSMASQPINRHSTGSYIGSLYNNFNSERLEGRGIPEGACTSHTQVYNDHIDTGFTYRHEPSNTDEPEIYFLLRL
ncbi:1-phosphatidylinositol 4,5-bisphosphate phosphodiesterase eta-1 isoform X4 [Xenopus tropicalis]|uniref:Phosphoinositide phospholipase C n=1 Tax=Xenopus tropicalis TaxID=8364 RepID=A0A6I8QCS0_XENTR|nr:1-phosphatidylinositol 4,5-bisphosphate phosphodiesterase eta-1 isoform X4 [Xenopus tropicalis]|eukprot:XP_012818898.1 PREDICTED: 1-phosphatidylinositol 4,5-bisphosphate phosphodiesterase eta-1 isoform X1 [Xenopus tropicalis]